MYVTADGLKGLHEMLYCWLDWTGKSIKCEDVTEFSTKVIGDKTVKAVIFWK